MALRDRRSPFMTDFFERQQQEDDAIREQIDALVEQQGGEQ